MQTCREGKVSNWQSLKMITGEVIPATELHHLHGGHMAHDQSLLLYRLFWLKANSQKFVILSKSVKRNFSCSKVIILITFANCSSSTVGG